MALSAADAEGSLRQFSRTLSVPKLPTLGLQNSLWAGGCKGKLLMVKGDESQRTEDGGQRPYDSVTSDRAMGKG